MSKWDGTFANSSVDSCTFSIWTCNSIYSSWMVCDVEYVLMAFKRHAPFMCSQRQTVFLFVQLTAEHWRHRFVLSNHVETHWNHLLQAILSSRNLFWRFYAIQLLSSVSCHCDLFFSCSLHLHLRRCCTRSIMLYACAMLSCLLGYNRIHAHGVKTPWWSICNHTHLNSCFPTCYSLVRWSSAVPCLLCFLLLFSTPGCGVSYQYMLLALKRQMPLLLDYISYSCCYDLFFLPPWSLWSTRSVYTGGRSQKWRFRC